MNGGGGGGGGEQVSGIPVKTLQTDPGSSGEGEYSGHGSGFFFSVFLVVAVLCIGGYLFWHNRKLVCVPSVCYVCVCMFMHVYACMCYCMCVVGVYVCVWCVCVTVCVCVW